MHFTELVIWLYQAPPMPFSSRNLLSVHSYWSSSHAAGGLHDIQTTWIPGYMWITRIMICKTIMLYFNSIAKQENPTVDGERGHYLEYETLNHWQVLNWDTCSFCRIIRSELTAIASLSKEGPSIFRTDDLRTFNLDDVETELMSRWVTRKSFDFTQIDFQVKGGMDSDLYSDLHATGLHMTFFERRIISTRDLSCMTREPETCGSDP